MLNISRRLSVCLLFASVGLAACGGEKKDASQVVAKVNGAEISVSQINQVLTQTPGVTEANAAQARKAILEKLIVQQLAVAKATDLKLDRTPAVIMALDAARREVLARAYFEQVAGAAANVDKSELRSYFDAHPDLFSERRIYSLTDITVKDGDKLIAPLNEMVAANKSMQDIAQWLKENGAVFEANNYTSAAEQLSLELLPSIAKLADGQTAVIPSGQIVHIINVVKSRQEPVDFATASPQIEKYLVAKRRQDLVQAEVKHLKDTAKVEYLGDFAKDAAPEAAPAPAAPAPEAQSGVPADIANGAAKL